MRLFIGIPFSPELKKHISERLNKIRPYISRARFSDSEGYHLTLKFLGEVNPQNALELAALLESIDYKVAPFELNIHDLGRFERHGGDILWTGIIANKELEMLQEITEKALVEAGYEPEQRRFKPHLTLARAVRYNAPFEELEQKWGKNTFAEKIEKVALFESIRKDGRLLYMPLVEKKLK